MALLESGSKAESPGILKAGNPPKSLAYWQGREREIAQMRDWLTDKNISLIGIEGIGGIGKSMLATKISEEIKSCLEPFWADVSDGAGFSGLAREVLTKFGFPVPEQETQLVKALVNCLCSGQFLLIIDNLESLLQPDRQWGSLFYSDFFNAWVEFGGNSKVLVTTRERPELKGFKWLPLKGLQVEEGVALLDELGIRGDLAEFVELVDGHPLLLKLVADLLKEEYDQDPDLRRLADLGLGNLRQLLTDPQVVGVHRQENVGIVLVLDASYERLSELQKTLLLNISVYRGAVDSAAAVAVLPGSSEKEIDRELRNLVKRSLLVEEKGRFKFQPVVLEYVRYKAGNQTEAHQRAIDYYYDLLNKKQEPRETKEDIREYLEIFYHWYQLKNYDSAFDVLNFCNEFLSLQGYYTVQVDLWGQLIAAWEKTGRRENWNYGAALTSLGNAYNSLGQYQRAIDFQQQSLKIQQQIGNRNGEAISLNNLGNAYNYLGEFQRAIEFFEQSLQIQQEIGDRNVEGLTLNNLGNAYNGLGNYQRAIEFFEESLKIFRQIGNRNGEGASLGNLGNVYNYLGEYQRAIQFFEECLKISKEIGDRNQLGISLYNLGNAYNYLGEYQQAIEFFGKSLKIFKEIGNPNQVAICSWNLGNAHNLLGQYQRAIEFYQQSLNIQQEIGDRNGEAASLHNLGNTYNYLGEYQQAIEFYQQSLNTQQEIGDRYGKALSLNNLGNAHNYLGEYQQAIQFFEESLEISREIGDRNTQGKSLANLGLAYLHQEEYQETIELCQQSLDISREIGDRNTQGLSLANLGAAYLHQEEYEEAIDLCQQSLDISREIGDRNSQAIAWFNLGQSLENVNRESDALVAYCNARELYQSMELDADVQDCDNAIERLS